MIKRTEHLSNHNNNHKHIFKEMNNTISHTNPQVAIHAKLSNCGQAKVASKPHIACFWLFLPCLDATFSVGHKAEFDDMHANMKQLGEKWHSLALPLL